MARYITLEAAGEALAQQPVTNLPGMQEIAETAVEEHRVEATPHPAYDDIITAIHTLVNDNAADLSALTTTAKGNLVAAVNEVKGIADAAAGGGVVLLGTDDPDPTNPVDGVLYIRLGETVPTPTGLTATSVTDAGFTLTWSASTGAVAYQVRLNAGAAVTATSPYTISGLDASTTYAAQVRAQNVSGSWSAWSAALSVTTDATPTGPVQVFSDDFNRANGDLTGIAPWGADQGGGAVQGNEAVLNGGFNRLPVAATFPRNCAVQAIVRSTGGYQGIYLGRNEINTGVKLFRQGGNFYLSNSEAWNSPAFGSVPFGATDGDVLRLAFDGTTFHVYRNGTEETITWETDGQAAAVAALAPGAAYVGMCGDGARWDDFSVWTL